MLLNYIGTIHSDTMQYWPLIISRARHLAALLPLSHRSPLREWFVLLELDSDTSTFESDHDYGSASEGDGDNWNRAGIANKELELYKIELENTEDVIDRLMLGAWAEDDEDDGLHATPYCLQMYEMEANLLLIQKTEQNILRSKSKLKGLIN